MKHNENYPSTTFISEQRRFHNYEIRYQPKARAWHIFTKFTQYLGTYNTIYVHYSVVNS